MSDIHRVSPFLCPACGYMADSFGNGGPDEARAPEPGDFSMCLRCGEILEFDEARRLAPVAPAHWAELLIEDPAAAARLQSMQVFVREKAARGDWIPKRGVGNA